ncbi:MAG: hypothetical protein LC798_16860 [Chloroflexi bacterium]|nr:hypothetical protein [Chloroflexota bacterium]
MTEPVWQAVWVLVSAALFAVSVAELFLLRRLEKEFQVNKGRSMRDLGDRMETRQLAAAAAAVRVAEKLLTAQGAVDGVAVDLAAAHDRADAVDGSPGEASDAASRRSPNDAIRKALEED